MKTVGKSRRVRHFVMFCLYALSGFFSALPMIHSGAISFLSPWIAPAIPVCCELYFIKNERKILVRAWARGVIFFWFYGAAVFSWFSGIYPLDYLGYNKAEAIFVIVLAQLFLPLLQAVFSAFVFVYAALMRKTGFFARHKIISYVGIAFVWAITEWVQTLSFLAVPWGRIAVGQAENPVLIQSVSLFGPYFIAFIAVLTAGFIAEAVSCVIRHSRATALKFLSFAVLVFFSNFIFGTVRIATADYSDEKTVKVAAVQGNIRFEDKFYGKEELILNTYRDLTVDAANDGAHLVIWPETAVPFDYESDEKYDFYLREVQKLSGADIVATYFKQTSEGLYNAVSTVTSDGISDTFYAKRHLVPFGEYVPYESFIEKVCPPLARFAAIDYPLAAGKEPCVFTVSSGKISSLVCFDSVFENLCREEILGGSQLLCISTNDSWFSGSEALRQHNLQAVLRSVESGRYTVRAANTGISSVISPTGEIITSLGDGERGYITADVKMLSEITLYEKSGNIIIPIGAAYAFTAVFVSVLRKKKYGNNN